MRAWNPTLSLTRPVMPNRPPGPRTATDPIKRLQPRSAPTGEMVASGTANARKQASATTTFVAAASGARNRQTTIAVNATAIPHRSSRPRAGSPEAIKRPVPRGFRAATGRRTAVAAPTTVATTATTIALPAAGPWSGNRFHPQPPASPTPAVMRRTELATSARLVNSLWKRAERRAAEPIPRRKPARTERDGPAGLAKAPMIPPISGQTILAAIPIPAPPRWPAGAGARSPSAATANNPPRRNPTAAVGRPSTRPLPATEAPPSAARRSNQEAGRRASTANRIARPLMPAPVPEDRPEASSVGRVAG